MPRRIPTFRPKGRETRQEQNTRYDRARFHDENRAKYRTQRWRRLAKWILGRDPFCVRCLLKGITTASTTANHIRRARDHPELFWEPANIEGVCTTCHNSDIQAEEKAPNDRD